MKKYLPLLALSSLLLASCRGPDTPQPNVTGPTQNQLQPGFTWVPEPLTVWQQQSLYDFSYWVEYDPVQLSTYSRQTYLGNNKFGVDQYSLSYSTWQEDPATALVFNPANSQWAELGASFTATEGPVGTSGVKSVYVTDPSGTKYYSLQKRELSGRPISEGIANGFGDGRGLPTVIKNGTATFSAGAEAYTWVMDQKDPIYAINRTHRVFTTIYYTDPLKTCATISNSCSSTATSLSAAINAKAWIINGGGNVSVRLQGGNKADVTYTGEDGNAAPQTFQVNYTYSQASGGAPERIIFDDLVSSDATLTAAISKFLAVGNGKLAVYNYGGKAVRGIYIPSQTGILSKSFQYNKVAINDILTKWNPSAPPVLK